MRRWFDGALLLLLAGCSSGGTDPEGPATVRLSTSRSTLVNSETAQIAAEVRDAQGAVLPNEIVSFSSSNPSIATVTGAGLVTGVGPGAAVISGRSGPATGQLTIVVEEGGLVTPAGGTVTGFAGAIEIVVPAGAVSAGTAVRITTATNPLLDPTAVAGSIYSISPEATAFAAAATVRVRFNAAGRPVGLPIADLRLRRYDGVAWVPLPGGAADVAASQATASLMAGGLVSVGWVPPATACDAAEYRQFDFWLGAWSVSTNGQTFAQSDISSAPGGCAIFEEYRATGVLGRSISFYQPATAKWYQTWVDNGGNRLTIAGGLVNAAMEMINPPGGAVPQERWRWTIEGGNVRQQAAISNNGGASYGPPTFDGLYTPR